MAIQDHAYNQTFLDTWTLITFLAAKTQRVHFLPDVADLPLRPAGHAGQGGGHA